MQKDFKEFTVGELLDLGLNVEVRKHGVQSIDDGVEITRKFEGTKQSTNQNTNFTTVNAWKGRFHVTVYVSNE